MSDKKILGENRRHLILDLLKNAKDPITGGDLAKEANVSRQVIVGDISLLKAKNEPIIATSQGYMYLSESPSNLYERTVACLHTPNETEEELNLLVDLGVMIKDVTVEHPVYGDLTASLHISSRKDVTQFIHKVQTKKASYLLELTNGIHMHTLSASNKEKLEDAVHALEKRGFLVQT